MLKDYQGGLQDFDKANDLEPHNAFTLRTRGNIKFFLKDFKGALEDLDKADSLEPNNVFTYRTRGNVKIMLSDYQGALEDLDKANVFEPNNASTLKSHGEVKKLLNDYQGAFQDFEKVNILEPRNAFNLTLRGNAKKMLQDYQGALEDLNKAHFLEPNNAFNLRTRGEVKRMLQDYQGALKDLDKAHFLEPNNAFTLRTRGAVKRMLKDYQGTLQNLVEANDLLPNNTFILVILSQVHWHLNNYRLALECLDKVDVNESDDYFKFQYDKKWLKWLVDEYQPIIESLQFNSNVRSFTFDELVTKNDSRKHLGQGSYGTVYEGNWEGKKIAIKVLKGVDGSFNESAKKSFISEVRTLGSIQHINLVQLLGYCIEGARHALVYEYMSKSSLDKWLFDDKLNHFLNWHERMHIIIGIAKGLAFLHQCNPIILHLDIKPQNILLDIDNTPKLADFGLARLLDGEQCQVCVTIIYLNLFCNDFVHMGIILCEPYIEKIFFIMPNFNFIK